MSHLNSDDETRLPCRYCGENLSHHKGYGPLYQLCSACAQDIANLFSISHGGAPLVRGERIGFRAKDMLNASQRWEVLRRDGFACRSCGCADRPMHVDHIVPRSKGGSDEDSNLQCLCDKCNIRKGAK